MDVYFVFTTSLSIGYVVGTKLLVAFNIFSILFVIYKGSVLKKDNFIIKLI